MACDNTPANLDSPNALLMRAEDYFFQLTSSVDMSAAYEQFRAILFNVIQTSNAPYACMEAR